MNAAPASLALDERQRAMLAEMGVRVWAPLADAPPFGLLVLASDDPQRFQPSMGTDFLRHLAELAGAALSRLLPVRHNSAP